MEAKILSEIRNSEKKAESTIERAKMEKDKIIQDSRNTCSKLSVEKEEEIRKSEEKKIMDFREKVKSMKTEKLKEGKKTANQLKAKAEKNIGKAVDLVMKKFEDVI